MSSQVAPDQANEKKIPVTVLTGFLGSGKTTLLSYILEDKTHGHRIAVIENEFASPIGVHNEVKHEHQVDEKSPFANASCIAEIIETGNGCLCCSGKGEFMNILQALIQNKDKFDYLIVETTGMADPTFASVFLNTPQLKAHFFLDGIITLVDAKHAQKQLSRLSPEEILRRQKEDNVEIINEAVNQIAFADRILINKIDLVPNVKEIDELETNIRKINAVASISRTKFSKVDLSSILDIRSFDIEKILKQDPGFLDFRPFRQHDDTIGSLTLIGKGDIQVEHFENWLKSFLKAKGNDVYRTKGILSVVNSKNKYVYQGVHDVVDLHEHTLWKEGEPRFNKMIFIGKNLDAKVIQDSVSQATGLKMKSQKKEETKPYSLRSIVAMIVLLLASWYPDQAWNLATSPWLIVAVVIFVILMLRSIRLNR